jgi:hypothetical protein
MSTQDTTVAQDPEAVLRAEEDACGVIDEDTGMEIQRQVEFGIRAPRNESPLRRRFRRAIQAELYRDIARENVDRVARGEAPLSVKTWRAAQDEAEDECAD